MGDTRHHDPVVSTSKFLSLVLRHRPDKIGLELDHGGWAKISSILAKVDWMDRAMLDRAVAENNKQRFAISDDGLRIRASQGHSIKVDLGLVPVTPPDVLYHGTYPGAVDAIKREGLKKMKRNHVHLSADTDTARDVGGRRGKPVLFQVDAKGLCEQGHPFFLSANDVWLAPNIPPEFILLLE